MSLLSAPFDKNEHGKCTQILALFS